MHPIFRPLGCVFVLWSLLIVGCGQSREAPSPEAPRGDDSLVIPTGSKSGSDQQTVTFLGSQGTGRHFCIIADCSKSLSEQSFGLIKREIAKTIESLDDTSKVFVVFFADKAYALPGGDWVSGKSSMEKIKPWMDSMPRILKTLPAPAFRMALKLKPKPDVIFLMTDGQLQPPGIANKLTALNAETKAIVNTILFTRTSDVKPPEYGPRTTLEQIAKENGGTYTQFIDPDIVPPKKKKKKG